MPVLRHTFAALAAACALAVPAAGQAQPNTPAPSERGYAWALPAMNTLVRDGNWPQADRAGLNRDATRRQLARGLAAVAVHRGLVPPADLALPPDMDPADPDATAAGWVRTLGLLGPRSGPFNPDAPVTGRVAHTAVVRALGLSEEMRGLNRIHTADGARLRVPAGFGAAILVRELGLRFNYPFHNEVLERSDAQPMTVADLAGLVARARIVDEWRLDALAVYRDVTLPDMTDAQRTAVQAALRQVGMPYIWGGDWPTSRSPWGGQAAGGFDCSGLVWMAFKGAPRSAALQLGTDLRGRTADDMAWEAPTQRVRLVQLAAGDLVFFGERGPRTKRGGIGHVGIALGNGWFVHSAGSRAGASISRLDTYWVSGQAWGRRPAALGPAPAPVNAAPITPPAPAPPPVPPG